MHVHIGVALLPFVRLIACAMHAPLGCVNLLKGGGGGPPAHRAMLAVTHSLGLVGPVQVHGVICSIHDNHDGMATVAVCRSVVKLWEQQPLRHIFVGTNKVTCNHLQYACAHVVNTWQRCQVLAPHSGSPHTGSCRS